MNMAYRAPCGLQRRTRRRGHSKKRWATKRLRDDHDPESHTKIIDPHSLYCNTSVRCWALAREPDRSEEKGQRVRE